VKSFIVHDGERIIRVGRCKDSDFDHQAAPGQYAIEGEADPNRNKIIDGQIVSWEPPEPDPAIEMRRERDRLLKLSDWTQLPDAPVDQQAWATYRQELRDLPERDDWPNIENWPVLN
jgi:hypothetical protein